MVDFDALKRTIDTELGRAREVIITGKDQSAVEPAFNAADDTLRDFEAALATPGYTENAGTHREYLVARKELLGLIDKWRISHLGSTAFTGVMGGSMYSGSPSYSRSQSDARRSAARLSGLTIRPQESPEAISAQLSERMKRIEAQLSSENYALAPSVQDQSQFS